MTIPDPKKYQLKKLNGKGYIFVDRQILRWRKTRPKLLANTKAKEIKTQVEKLYTPEPTPPTDPYLNPFYDAQEGHED